METLIESLSQAKHPSETQTILREHAKEVNSALVGAIFGQAQEYQQEADFTKAIHLALVTIQAAEQWGDPTLLAAAWAFYGEVLDMSGDLEGAFAAQQYAAKRYAELGNEEEMANSLGDCGRIALLLGKPSEAQAFLEQALARHRALKNDEGVVKALLALGTLPQNLSQQAEAETLQEALTLSRAIDYAEGEADALSNLGSLARQRGAWSEATSLLTQALQIQQKISSPQGEAVCQLNFGHIYRAQGLLSEALAAYTAASELAQKHGLWEETISAANSRAAIYDQRGDFKAAEKLYLDALQQSERVGYQMGVAAVCNSLGTLYQVVDGGEDDRNRFRGSRLPRGLSNAWRIFIKITSFFDDWLTKVLSTLYQRFLLSRLPPFAFVTFRQGRSNSPPSSTVEKAIYYLERASNIYREIGYRRGEATALDNLGFVYRELGQLSVALEYHQQAQAIYRELGDEVSGLTSMGIIHKDLGDVGQALDYLESAAAKYRERSMPKQLGHALTGLGQCWGLLNDREKVLDYFQLAFNAYEKAEDYENSTIILNNMGLAELSQGDFDAALSYLQKALQKAKAIQDRWVQAAALNALGKVYQKRQNFEQALLCHQTALALAQEVGYLDGEISAWQEIGNMAHQLGHFDDAQSSLDEALRLADQLQNPISTFNVRLSRGQFGETRNQFAEAATEYLRATQAAESIRARLDQEAHKMSYWGQDVSVLYAGLVLLLHQELQDDIAAWQNIERVKSRTFLDQLAQTPLPKPPDLPSDLYEQEQALLEQIRGLLSARREAKGQRLLKLGEALRQKEEELNQIWAEIRKSAPEYATLRQGEPISWPELQESLGTGIK